MYRYAEKAPGSTVMYPKTDSLHYVRYLLYISSKVTHRGLSRMFDILYSKFCAATRILLAHTD